MALAAPHTAVLLATTAAHPSDVRPMLVTVIVVPNKLLPPLRGRRL